MKPIEAAIPEDDEDLDVEAKERVEALLERPQPDRDAETVDGELEDPEGAQ